MQESNPTHDSGDPGDPEPAGPAPAAKPGGAQAIVIYTLLRLGLLAVTLFVLSLFGLRSVELLLLGFLVSGLISFFVLDRKRDEVSATLAGTFSRINGRIASDTRKEDLD